VKGTRAKPRRTRPLFERDSRVTWQAPEKVRGFYTRHMVAQYGTVKDIHKLGARGYAYEIARDGDSLPEEITECELAAVPPYADPALRDLLERLRDVAPEGPASLKALRDAWVRAGCPGA
jgi:hypothetical protein